MNGFLRVSQVAAFAVALLCASAQAQMFKYEVKDVDVVKTNVSYPHSDDGEFVYEAETGQYILAWKFDVGGYGRQGVNVLEKTAANTERLEESKVNEILHEIEKFAKEQGKEEQYREQIENYRKYFRSSYSFVKGSHSRLKLRWWVRHDGSEFNRRGGSIDFTLKLQLARIQSPEQTLEEARAKIRAGEALITASVASGAIPFKSPTKPHCYIMEDGKKRHIASEATFFALGFKFDQLQLISDEVLNAIPTGPPIP